MSPPQTPSPTRASHYPHLLFRASTYSSVSGSASVSPSKGMTRDDTDSDTDADIDLLRQRSCVSGAMGRKGRRGGVLLFPFFPHLQGRATSASGVYEYVHEYGCSAIQSACPQKRQLTGRFQFVVANGRVRAFGSMLCPVLVHLLVHANLPSSSLSLILWVMGSLQGRGGFIQSNRQPSCRAR